MRIASISLVKNEADIIECFVRHNMAFVDRMYVIDDRSTDNTPEILRRLAEEFPDLTVVDDNWRGGISQSARTSRLLHQALSEEDWDIVTALDADEFIASVDRSEFEEDLSGIPSGMAGSYREICYIVSDDDDQSIVDPRHRLRVAIDRNGPHGFKAIMTKSLLQFGSVDYDNGNHRLLIGESSVSNWQLPRVKLAHFPLRSAEHAICKVISHYVGWRSCHAYHPRLASQVMQAIEVLKSEHCLSPAAQSLIGRMMPETLIAPREVRPFTEGRGTMKWPELAKPLPYSQLVGLLDQLITRAAIGDSLARTAEGATDADCLQALVQERNALERELNELRRSRSQLFAAWLRTFRSKTARNVREWRLKLSAMRARRAAGSS